MVTYVLSASVTETWAAPIVLTVRLAAVWLTLRVSQARRVTRLIPGIVLCLAAVVAVVGFFAHKPLTTVGYGNLVPAANPGQTFAVLEAVTGQRQ